MLNKFASFDIQLLMCGGSGIVGVDQASAHGESTLQAWMGLDIV
jgi:hypothetical protein